MYKKKSSLFILTLLLGIFLTGCGVDTIGFLNHVDEMQKISTTKPTQTVSRISISDINLPTEEIPTGQKELVQAITDFLNDHYITLTQTVHPEKDIVSISIDTIQKHSLQYQKENLLTLNYKDQAFAISTGSKLKELPQHMQATINLFSDQLIPISAFEQLLGGQQLALSSFSNRQSLLDISDKSMAYLKEFGKIYSTLDAKLITKTPEYGGSFLFKMDTPEFVKFFDAFVSLSIQNYDGIIGATANFYESLTEEEFNMLYGTMLPDGKAEMIALLKEAMEMPIPEDISETWKTVYHAEIAPLITSTMDGSSVSMRAWKDNNKYYTNTYGSFKITTPDDPSVKFGSTILIKEELQVVSNDFDVTMPTVVISDDLIKSLLPSSVEILVNEKNESIEETLDTIIETTIDTESPQ